MGLNGLLLSLSFCGFFAALLPNPVIKSSLFVVVRQFGDNHKVKLGKNRSKTNGVKLSKMASGLWGSLRYFVQN